MRLVGATLKLSAHDLAGHVACRHKTALDAEVARGVRDAPPSYSDPMMDLLRERGREHEAAYVDSLGVTVADRTTISELVPGDGVAATAEAMRRGVEVIVQASLANGRWLGRADVLRRVPVASALGPWSYEPIDTKLAEACVAG